MRTYLFIITLVCSFLNLRSQLVVDNTTYTPTQLVQDILVGQGVTVTSVNFVGTNNQIAYFNGTNSNVGFDEGIILASGNVSNAIGPNNQSGASSSEGGAGYADLTTIAGVNTNDAAVLSFDFVPSSGTVVFEYVFASEEYMEYVGGGINDAFGFFVSGPGINGPYANNAINVALLPDGVTPVTIDNVNANTNNSFYIDNGDGAQAPFNANNVFIQYDGITVTLRAEMDLTPCETYTLVIAIADGMDSSLDSGVFLKKGSLSANNLQTELVVNGPSTGSNIPEVVEGCNSVDLTLAVLTPVQNDTTINFIVGGTATVGDDYVSFGNSLQISAGDTSVTINIDAIIDNLPEGTETIEIYIPTSVCETDTLIINIVDEDYYPLNIVMPNDTAFCGAGSVTLSPIVTGGIGTLIYDWDSGANNTLDYSVSPNSPTTYSFVVTDECALSASGTVDVNVGTIPNANAGADDQVCAENDLVIGSSGEVGVNYSWSPSTGLNDPTLAQPTLNYSLPGSDAIVETYIVISNNGDCANQDTVEITINPSLLSDFDMDTTLCEGEEVTVTYTGNADATANFNWQFGTANVISGSGIGPYVLAYNNAGNDIVSLAVDDVGCNDGGQSQNVVINSIPNADAGVAQQICSGESVGLGVSGTLGLTYLWSPGNDLSDSLIADPTATLTNVTPSPLTQTFYLTVNNNGCINMDSVDVTINPEPVYSVSVDASQCEYENEFDFTSSGNTDPSVSSFYWDFDVAANVTASNDQNPSGISFNQTGAFGYSLSVVAYGCTSEVVIDSVYLFAAPNAGFDSAYYGACIPYSYTLTNTSNGASSYDWIINGMTSSDVNPTVSVDTSGTYDVSLIATTSQGCVDTVSYLAVLEGFDIPISGFNMKDSISEFNPQANIFSTAQFGDSCTYLITGANGVLDSLNDCSFTYHFPDTGWYNVTQTVYNEYGCQDVISKAIYVEPEYVIYVPNAFTPDNDGVNDIWFPILIGENSFELIIFNRWGEEVYKTEDKLAGWNGTFQGTGEMLPQGIYVYIIRTTNSYGDPIEKLGHITMIR